MQRVQPEYRVSGSNPLEPASLNERGYNNEGDPLISDAVLEARAAATVDMRELQHRMENIMTVVQAICRQTMRLSSSKEDFDQKFSGRLSAYSNSIQLLIAGNWQGLALHNLIASQLATFGSVGSGQISVVGPDLNISTRTAHYLSLALHELATNAAKYGSLSAPYGRVEITWSANSSSSGDRFQLQWRELGGPPVAEPDRHGFGHQFLQDLCASALSARTRYEFRPDGVRYLIDAPASEVVVGTTVI